MEMTFTSAGKDKKYDFLNSKMYCIIVINVQERYKMGTVREEIILSRVISLMVHLQRRRKV